VRCDDLIKQKESPMPLACTKYLQHQKSINHHKSFVNLREDSALINHKLVHIKRLKYCFEGNMMNFLKKKCGGSDFYILKNIKSRLFLNRK